MFRLFAQAEQTYLQALNQAPTNPQYHYYLGVVLHAQSRFAEALEVGLLLGNNNSYMLQRIGRYQDLERIGGGAFGTVYRATDPVLDRPVAIKVINQPVTNDREFLEALLRIALSSTQ